MCHALFKCRAQFCLLKWWPERPNFVFGDQNLNLVTSVIEFGHQIFGAGGYLATKIKIPL
jgi:hypothetical protein